MPDKLKVGVMVESFRLGFTEGVKKAAEVGAQGIQVSTIRGELDPDNLSKTGRQDILHFIESHNLRISALCGDLGGHGFQVANDNEWRIQKSKKILDLARDLKTDVVTTHIGLIVEDEKDPGRIAIKEACEEVGNYGEKVGVRFAVETGPEKADVMKKFLGSLKTRAVMVNYDPANLVMVAGEDPVKGVRILRDYIVHTHAKDGVRLKAIDPKIVYGYFPGCEIEEYVLSSYFKEVPLGEGHVDFEGYIEAMREIGYDGFFTIEREVGRNPVEDILKAVKFLQSF